MIKFGFPKCQLLRLTLIYCFYIFLGCQTSKFIYNDSNNNKKIFQKCMVVCSDKEAALVGKNILKKGGNAFDAAASVQFALQVTHPRAGNIGGGGFLVYRLNNGLNGSLDFREKAPASAFETMFLDSLGQPILNKSLIGALAVGVPGSVEGIYEMHRKFGKLTWQEVLEPSILLAQNGFELTSDNAQQFNYFKQKIKEVSTFETPFNSKEWKAGDVFYQHELAKTLKLIQRDGSSAFYEGEIANAIVKTMKHHGGLITLSDLKNYQSVWRKPIIVPYKNFRIITMGPPSSGGSLIGQMLLGNEIHEFTKNGINSTSYVHGMIEMQRRVFADRADFYGDPDFVEIPLSEILSKDRCKKLFSNIDYFKKTNSEEIKAGNETVIESFETTHFSIVDTEGNAVGITTTLNGLYGSLLMVEGFGFLLNNEMDDFSAKPGYGNQFGLIGGKNNQIEPNKRMLSSMSPSIVEKNGQFFAVIGSPGGSTIINTVAETIFGITDFNLNIEEAILAPKFHSQWKPDEVYYEEAKFKPEIIDSLKVLGHKMIPVQFLGKLDCIQRLQNGKLMGGTDAKKGDGTVEGF